MKQETENAIRSIATLDPEISSSMIEKVIDIFRGKSDESQMLIHTVRFRDALELLNVHRMTLQYYLNNGYLDRVYGCGKRAIGVSRESLLRFMNRKVVRHSAPQNNTTECPEYRRRSKKNGKRRNG